MNALDFLISQAWAIERPYLDGLIALASDPEARKMTERQTQRVAQQEGAIAIVPIAGILTPKGSWIMELFGLEDWGNMAHIGRAVTAAAENPDTKLIVLDIDSPGGMVAGSTELAAQIRAARERVPIIGQVNHAANSAAYWAASQATEIVTTPSGKSGAIGVLGVYESRTEEEDATIEILSAGKYKSEATGERLADDARKFLQGQIEEAYDMMVADIAAGRRVDEDIVRNGYGEGRSLTAKQAIKAKVVDRVATLDETIARFVGTQNAAQSRRRALALSRAQV